MAEGGLSPLCSQVTNDVIGRKWLYFGITKGGGRGEMGEENERRIEKVIFSRQKIGKRRPARWQKSAGKSFKKIERRRNNKAVMMCDTR